MSATKVQKRDLGRALALLEQGRHEPSGLALELWREREDRERHTNRDTEREMSKKAQPKIDTTTAHLGLG